MVPNVFMALSPCGWRGDKELETAGEDEFGFM